MFKSFSSITTGFIAVMVGYTSSIAIIFQAAAAAGANSAEVSSWLLALGIGTSLSTIGLSLYYRMPILTAWSTPGAALLATSLVGFSYPEAIGAFIVSSLLIVFAGVTGFFEKFIKHVPKSLASAMFAGILLHFGTNIFVAMQHQFLLVCTLFIAYLIGKRLFPQFVVFFILCLGMIIARIQGLYHLDNFHMTMSSPVFTMPVFHLSAIIGISIPLFIVSMCSQNIPGLAVLEASGYKPPISSIISWTGITNLLISAFGGFTTNLAAITAAICSSKESEPDMNKRYKASVYAGIFYLISGLFGATVVALFYALPKELILAVAGLALLGTIASSLQIALADESHREPALITLLVSSSGMTLFGIGSAFWGLGSGLLALGLLKIYKEKQVNLA